MRRAAAALGIGLMASAIGACVYSLDESRLRREGESVPSADASRGFVATFVERCTRDSDCQTNHGCFTGQCDPVRLTCTYASCRTAGCTVGRCDETRTCVEPREHSFLAAEFPVRGGVGCQGVAGRCIAAVAPYLFVGTTLGVQVFPVAAAPGEPFAEATLSGLDFDPVLMVRSGRRVYFVAPARGAGLDEGRDLHVAWVDVPIDPTRTSLQASSVVLRAVRNDLANAFAGPGETLVLVGPHTPGGTMTVRTPESPVDGGALEPSALDAGVDGGGPNPSVVAASGDRLLLFDVGTAANPNQPRFALASNGGTAAMRAGSMRSISGAVGLVVDGPPYSFATSPGGAIAWSAPMSSRDAGAGAPPNARVGAIRATWLTNDGRDVEVYAQVAVEIERYPATSVPLAAGGLAWVDDRVVVALTEADEDRRQTHVTAATRADGGAVLARGTLDLQTAQTGVTADDGVAYVLEAKYPDASLVRVVAPGCAP